MDCLYLSASLINRNKKASDLIKLADLKLDGGKEMNKSKSKTEVKITLR